MTESHINWRVGPDDAEWDFEEHDRLHKEARRAKERFEELAGRPWSSGPRDDDLDAVSDAGSEVFHALMAEARHSRLRNSPISQRDAARREKSALIWLASDDRLKEHGVKWADYWTDRILELFEPFGGELIPGRNIAIEALGFIIRHCTVCPNCDAISYHRDPPKGREKKCGTCRRWERRLKPYPGLETRSDFMMLLRMQGGKCALCIESDPLVPEGALDGWHIDHDHATGRVRGILCPSCNAKVGRHESDRDGRVAIEDYLRR